MENEYKRTVAQLISGAEGKLDQARDSASKPEQKQMNLLLDSIAASLLAIAKCMERQ